jgi:hypothetical protein
MTGMVKEEILTRQMELGFSIENGCLVFNFLLLNRDEFLVGQTEFAYLNVHGRPEKMELPAGSVAYTVCQVPILLQISDELCIEVHFSDSSTQQINGFVLDSVNSQHIFQRDDVVHHLVVCMIANR